MIPTWLISLVIELCLLGWMSQHGDFPRSGEAIWFALLGVAAGAAYWKAIPGFSRAALPARQKTCLFWGAAVALRLAILPVTAGDDIWRYLWEGKIQLHGFNPYLLAPDSPFLTDLRDAEWAKINHRAFPAIYPPLAELIFAATAACGLPVLGYKLLFGLADLGSVAVLRQLLLRGGKSADSAAWYAWNPLAVYVSAGAAHFDSLMVLPLLGAILLLERVKSVSRGLNETTRWRSLPMAASSTLLLAVAVAIKIVPAALLPVWAFALGWRRALTTLPIFVAAVLIPSLHYGFPDVPVFTAARGFALGFRVNDAVWWIFDIIRRGDLAAPVSSVETTFALLACGGLAVWLRRDWRRGLLWVMGATILLAPVVHAWYVVWILPVAAWRGAAARSWFVLSISIFGYFLLWEVNHASGRPWEEPLWLRLVIYLPPLVVFGWQRWQSRQPVDASPAECGK